LSRRQTFGTKEHGRRWHVEQVRAAKNQKETPMDRRMILTALAGGLAVAAVPGLAAAAPAEALAGTGNVDAVRGALAGSPAEGATEMQWRRRRWRRWRRGPWRRRRFIRRRCWINRRGVRVCRIW
jgi:hypothetical protein